MIYIHFLLNVPGEKCIKVGDNWYNPIEFEEYGGRGSSKNWKFSIKHDGITLGKLIKVCVKVDLGFVIKLVFCVFFLCFSLKTKCFANFFKGWSPEGKRLHQKKNNCEELKKINEGMWIILLYQPVCPKLNFNLTVNFEIKI